MSTSPAFNVRVVPNDIVGQAAVTLAPYSWSSALNVPSLQVKTPRLDPNNPDGEDYPNCAGGEVTNTYDLARSWIWGSRAVYDHATRSVLWVSSPHGFDEFGGYLNAYITLLHRWNLVSTAFLAYEAPINFGGPYPRTVGHSFDNVCIVGRSLYKFTHPLWQSGAGYLQPQIVKFNLDALTDDVTSGRQGATYQGQIPPPFQPPDLTAGVLDYLPGCNCLVSLHKSRIDFYDLTAAAWITPFSDLAFTTPNAFHNIGHYQPTAGVFVGGGGAYQGSNIRNRQFVKVHGTTRAITNIDNSPVVFSMSEANLDGATTEVKGCATFDPNSTESIFFHDNGLIYGLDTTRPAGSHWRVIGANTSGVEADIVCGMPEYGCIAVFNSRAAGLATVRLYRGA